MAVLRNGAAGGWVKEITLIWPSTWTPDDRREFTLSLGNNLWWTQHYAADGTPLGEGVTSPDPSILKSTFLVDSSNEQAIMDRIAMQTHPVHGAGLQVDTTLTDPTLPRGNPQVADIPPPGQGTGGAPTPPGADPTPPPPPPTPPPVDPEPPPPGSQITQEMRDLLAGLGNDPSSLFTDLSLLRQMGAPEAGLNVPTIQDVAQMPVFAAAMSNNALTPDEFRGKFTIPSFGAANFTPGQPLPGAAGPFTQTGQPVQFSASGVPQLPPLFNFDPKQFMNFDLNEQKLILAAQSGLGRDPAAQIDLFQRSLPFGRLNPIVGRL